jgi:hypothetical protein
LTIHGILQSDDGLAEFGTFARRPERLDAAAAEGTHCYIEENVNEHGHT